MSGGDDFLLRALTPEDSFGSLKSGAEAFAPLKQFAKKQALKYERANLARTYVIRDEGQKRVAAFITLVCSEVASKVALLNGDEPPFPYEHYPAVKIARLMVDERYRGENTRGFGRTLVDFTLGIARTEICPAIGCRFVVVDSKKDSVKFYEKCGFTVVDTDTNRQRPEPVMFMDLHKAATSEPVAEIVPFPAEAVRKH